MHRSGFTFDADCHGSVVGATRCSLAHLARLQSVVHDVWSSVCMLLFLQATVAAVHCVCGPDSVVDAMASLVEAVDYDMWGGLCRTRLVLPGIGGDVEFPCCYVMQSNRLFGKIWRNEVQRS